MAGRTYVSFLLSLSQGTGKTDHKLTGKMVGRGVGVLFRRQHVFWIGRDSVDEGNKAGLVATTKAQLKLVAMNSSTNK